MIKVKRCIIMGLAVFGLLAQGCSCDTWTRFWGGDPECVCKDHWTWRSQKELCAAQPCPAPVQQPCAAPALQRIEAGACPKSGDEIELIELVPSQVVLNEPFDFRLKVTNTTDREVANVTVVTELKPEHMRIISSEPEMRVEEGQVRWKLGALGPGASRTININAVAEAKGEITSCVDVTYDTPTCAKIEIVDPVLQLTKIAPVESLKCDRIPLKYIVTNTGSGYACDIKIEDTLSSGMMASGGQSVIQYSIDTLGPGESREFSTMVDATKTGSFASRAIANSRTGGSAESAIVGTVVTQPILAIEQKGPRDQYLGRDVTYEVVVTNRGDATASDTVIEVMVPEDVQFRNASDGGRFTRSSPGKVTWEIGSLAPQQSKKVLMTVTTDKTGELIAKGSAKAYCAEMVFDSTQTKYSGIRAILLEVVDVVDPVELGKETTYVITVTNQGTAADKNIRVSCMLEEGMQYVSSSGPSKPTVTGNMISFAPLSSLAAKDSVRWQVNIKAVGAGSKRFKTVLNSEMLDKRPVDELEATEFYELK